MISILFDTRSTLFFLFVSLNYNIYLHAASLRNILLITVDDLRPQLAAGYDMPQIFTPNLDRLVSESLTFQRAYCQMAVCGPSRNSFMTGRRPDTTKCWNFHNHFRQHGRGANWTTMPQYFKQNGYLTYGYAKTFHPSLPPNNDFPLSWTNDSFNPYYWGNGPPIGDTNDCKGENMTNILSEWGKSRAICHDNNPAASMNDQDNRTTPQAEQDTEYDHRVATRTIEALSHAKKQGKHFFIAAGFRRPHLPWRHPKQFWDMYENIDINVAKHQTIGKNISILAYEMNGGGQVWSMAQKYTHDGKTYRESPDGKKYNPLPKELQQLLRRGYYASLSFFDFEVGRLIDTLEKLSLSESTALLLHSDHGWKLGEHGDWSKCSNWELDARVPLLIRAPWEKSSVGKRTLAIAELVDIFPTLVDLAGLPPVAQKEGLEGISLVPVLQQPDSPTIHNKTSAFSQFPRCPQFDLWTDGMNWECAGNDPRNITRMGYSVRVADARYTEWRIWKPTCVADWTIDGLVAQELYDHVGDVGLGAKSFDDYEYINIAYEPDRKEQVRKLASLIYMQFYQSSPQC